MVQKNVQIDDIGASSEESSAAIQIDSITRGLLLPRMSTTQRDAITSPTEGLKIWNLTTNAENNYDGTLWVASGGGGGSSGIGTETIIALVSDVLATAGNENILAAAQTGTADDLIEITGMTVGDRIALRANAGDTITVKHNDGGATIKIFLFADADFVLDEDNPLILRLVSTNILAQDVDSVGGGGGAVTSILASNTYLTVAAHDTTSGTLVDVDATNIAITGTLTGGAESITWVFFKVEILKQTGGKSFWAITDGTTTSIEFEHSFTIGRGNLSILVGFRGLSAGSTTFKLQFRTDDANQTRLPNNSFVSMYLAEVA